VGVERTHAFASPLALLFLGACFLSAFRKIGDAFLFYLLGHEYAHGIQARLGITHQFGIEHELQADCMAGAYLGIRCGPSS
jgi:predicted metalloprotease